MNILSETRRFDSSKNRARRFDILSAERKSLRKSGSKQNSRKKNELEKWDPGRKRTETFSEPGDINGGTFL
ncbi:hypothetical protein CH375_13445 [Leptospira ellisii]|uniref:Uncharacterized protein n=1 Tax=Leptospira ellisii TaxID=2023197 RepID=A0A2N0B3S9_9LEPT|nr:hypothetical protein CH379_20275 [Leptospira ellisii]PKA04027.1 hypothetical protein CH375_13445 [Leptospira ellisii]